MSLDRLYDFLRVAVSDGGLTFRDRVEMEARDADDLEMIVPIYAALAAWGRDGLDRIVKIALDGRTVKSKSAALTVLTSLANSGRLSVSKPLMLDTALAAFLDSKIDPSIAAPAARQALRILILSLPTDDLFLPLSQSFFHLQFASPDLAQQLVSALTAKWFHFGLPTLDKYEEMLVQHAKDEGEFHKFLCTFPQMLDPMALQVWSKPDFHGRAEPDFIIRRADDSYLVVEIECPAKMLLTKSGQLSHEATHAEKQALDYEAFLSERVAEARTHFPNYSRADCLAVIGLERDLTLEQRRALDRQNSRRQDLKVVGFDRLLSRSRTLISNVGEGKIAVVTKHRVV